MTDRWTKAALGDVVSPFSVTQPFKAGGTITKGDPVIAGTHTDEEYCAVVVATTGSSGCLGIALQDAVSGGMVDVLLIGAVVVKAGTGGITAGYTVGPSTQSGVANLANLTTAGKPVGRGLQTFASGELGVVFIGIF